MPNTTSTSTSAASSSSSTKAPTTGPYAQVNALDLVYNVDVFLLCVLALFFLLTVPKIVIRFTQASEWTAGHFLHYITPQSGPLSAPSNRRELTRPAAALQRSPTGRTFDSEKNIEDDDDPFRDPAVNLYRNKSSASARANLLRNTSSASGRVRRPYENAPAHMPSWTTMLPRMSSIVTYPLRPEISIGKAFILTVYTCIMIYGVLYKSNPFTQPTRAAYVAISQIPVVILLASKNNLLGMLIGFSYERLNFLHRFAARIAIICINIHALGFIYMWSINGIFTQKMKITSYQAAVVALVAIDVIALTSLRFMREKFHGIFKIYHVSSVIILLVAAYIHSQPSHPYIYVTLGIYLFDRVTRIIRTRYTVARLTPLPDLGMTRIEILGVNAGWRAGQHVRIRVLSRGMGLLGWWECHPFTIVSVSKGFSEEGLVLMCKKVGTWTTRLYDLSRKVEYGEAGTGISQDVKVLVEGPYGGPGHTVFSSFSGALFVAGGSGITYALATFQELIQKDLEGESRLKVIELVWSIQDPASLLPLLSLFADLLSLRTYATLRVSIYYTRPPAPSSSVLKTLSTLPLPANLSLYSGRPKVGQSLTNVLDEACALSMFKKRGRGRGEGTIGGGLGKGGKGLSGVVVGVCGPRGLCDEVVKVTRGVDRQRKEAVGGLEVHEEVFSM
ncbi:hypothetical protein C8Q75DRAFT_803744 [Abortiporus biennis]|nr:hypothetical protein C8Q75DRAFT_803744 [Abortiporus biennis]